MLKNLPKIILFVFIVVVIRVLFSLNSNNGYQKKTDLAEMNLFGKVKSVRETSYYAIERFGKVVKDNRKRDDYSLLSRDFFATFDVRGYKVTKEVYDFEGLLEEAWRYKYDSLHRNIEVIKYDQAGEIASEVKNIFDENNRKIESYALWGKGEFSKSSKHKYDNENKLIEELEYLGNGTLWIKLVNKYDDNDNVVEEKIFNVDNELDEKTTMVYYESNLIKELINYKVDFGERKFKFQYDNFGNKTEIEYWFNKKKYKEERFQFEYDEKNNWIVKIKYLDDKLLSIAERELEYFEE